MIEVRIPSVGESVAEIEIGSWLKHEGDRVAKDENIVVIESDKSTIELPAPADGVLGKIHKQAGEKASVGEIIAAIEPANGNTKTVAKPNGAQTTTSAHDAPRPTAPAATETHDDAAQRPSSKKLGAEQESEPISESPKSEPSKRTKNSAPPQ